MGGPVLKKEMFSVHGLLLGWMLQAMGGPGPRNLGPCHLYCLTQTQKFKNRYVISIEKNAKPHYANCYLVVY